MRLTDLRPSWIRTCSGGPICGVRFKNPMDQNQNLKDSTWRHPNWNPDAHLELILTHKDVMQISAALSPAGQEKQP